jgi:predicted TIM-barrel fold metal-dependent hydrolase
MDAVNAVGTVEEFPKIVSVDDHVVEPPNVWQDRLPAKYRDVGPRIVRAPMAETSLAGGVWRNEMGTEGPPVDWFLYEDLKWPHTRINASVGMAREDITMTGMTYDEMRPGCYDPAARLDDMDANWVEASLCFPSFPRFCGQTFHEAADKELAMLCVKAYNDWMVDEWCGGSGGRLIPLCLIPLWDPTEAAAEIRRNADRGVRAVTFSEIPPNLGLPSIHDRDGYWHPFFDACNETGTVICMHIGSGSKMVTTSPDAPIAVASTLAFANASYALTDWLMSGLFTKFPDLTLALSEGQIGWIPYIIERADVVWEENRGWNEIYETVTEPPSDLYRRHFYGCFFRDRHGVRSLDDIGVDTVTFETDYPHPDSTWPDSRAVAEEETKGLDRETIEKVIRGNAIRMLQLDL